MTRAGRARLRTAAAAFAVALVGLGAPRVEAELPATSALLADLGFSADDIAQVQAGTIVHHDVPPASDRELTSGLAFEVSVPPAQLVADGKQDLLDRVSPGMLAYGTFSGAGSAADLAKLVLQPDPQQQVQLWTSAKPGETLNLSSAEIAAFGALGSGATPAAVETQLRSMLVERLHAYRAQGLAGIAPYARGGGASRSPGDELRTATEAAKPLAKYAPDAYRLLLGYPAAKPAGTEEAFRWSQFEAHGTPTIVLTHVLLIPDGDAWIFAQRQFYVSTGYNIEQALAAFLPVQGGTVVVYGNRTSTDQITGFGGGAKRSIGSEVLTSQLESMFEKARAAIR